MTETIETPTLDGVLHRIRYRPGGFKPIESRIAKAILEDPRWVAREPIVEFAQRISVSTGSVVRFSKIMGFSGFHDLKLALAESATPDPAPRTTGAERSRFHQHMDEQMKAMLLAAEQVDPASIEHAASVLAKTKRVDISATGASAVAAQSLLFSLTLLGLHVRFLPDSAEQGAAAAFIGPGDCLIAITYSGRTRATVDSAERASKRGATVIALTCNRRAPVLRHAGIALIIDARTNRFEAEWPLRTAMFAVTRSLTLHVADEFSQDDLLERRSTWASGRFGMRYADTEHAVRGVVRP